VHDAAQGGGGDEPGTDAKVEEIDWGALDRFDIVGVTGMNVQRERQRQILERLGEIGTYVVVGGPYGSGEGGGRVGGCGVLPRPMLLRVLPSRNGSTGNKLSAAVQRAISGGSEGVVHMNSDRCCDA